MEYAKTLLFFSLVLVVTLLISCNTSREEDNRIIGVKIYDHQDSFEELFSQWNDLGINTAFSSLELLSNNEYRTKTAEHQISTFVIFPVFFNAEQLVRQPDLYAITSEGNLAKEE